MDDLIFDLVLFGLIFWAGYLWGKHMAVMRMLASIVENPEHLGRALDKLRAHQAQAETPADQLLVERVDDQIYIYDLEREEFLAQGATLEQALDRVAQRFPDRRYSGHLTREQADALAIKPKQT